MANLPPQLAAFLAAAEPALTNVDSYSVHESVRPISRGEAARFDFWCKMWLPLAALLLAGSEHMIAFAVLFAINCVFVVIALGCAIVRVRQSWFRTWIQSNPAFGVQVIGLPFLLCHLIPLMLNASPFHLPLPINGTIYGIAASETTESVDDWRAVIVSAALTYIIFIYCLSTSRQKKCPFPWVYHVLMVCTTFALYLATGAELVKIENLVAYFKTASLVALLCCAPHHFPGLSHTRSTSVVQFFVIFVLPVTFGIQQLMKCDMTSNGTVIAKVDEYAFWTVVIYHMLYLWDTYFRDMDEKDEEMDSISTV